MYVYVNLNLYVNLNVNLILNIGQMKEEDVLRGGFLRSKVTLVRQNVKKLVRGHPRFFLNSIQFNSTPRARVINYM